eukprot:1186717-Prorocentrum_minimum.AAC.3
MRLPSSSARWSTIVRTWTFQNHETNRRREASIFPTRTPIAGGRRAYSRRGHQSREGGEHIPDADTNRGREASIFTAAMWTVRATVRMFKGDGVDGKGDGVDV